MQNYQLVKCLESFPVKLQFSVAHVSVAVAYYPNSFVQFYHSRQISYFVALLSFFLPSLELFSLLVLLLRLFDRLSGHGAPPFQSFSKFHEISRKKSRLNCALAAFAAAFFSFAESSFFGGSSAILERQN